MLRLLYPDRCPMCGEISEGVCAKCLPELKYAESPRCFCCGKPLEDENEEYCTDCRDHPHSFIKGRGLFLYRSPVRESIHKIKYQNKREYLEYYAQILAEKLGSEIAGWNPEMILPIPMHKKKKRLRGYNQAEILAEKLGMNLNLPVCTKGLLKVQETQDQKKLSHRQRRQNLRHAFAINSDLLGNDGNLPWKTVLLTDDVYTTGSTMDAAAEVLKTYGVEKVYFITICIGEGL